MKKVFLTLVVFLSFLSISSAESLSESILTKGQPTVAVFILIDPNGVAKPFEAAEGIYNALSEELNSNNAKALPYDDTKKILRTYIRENNFGDNARESDMGFNPKQKDLQSLATESGADYVLFVSSRLTAQEAKRNFWTGKRQQSTILFDILLIKKGETSFLVDDTYTDIGKTSGSFERAYKRATKNILKQIDLSTITFTK